MMDQAAATGLLLRWNEVLHEHHGEIQELRAAGISESRIQSLYPSRGSEDYTAKITQLLQDPKSFRALHRRFKPDRNLLASANTGWSLVMELSTEVPPRPYRAVYFGTAQTGKLVDVLHRLYPKKFKRWVTSAHEFASTLLAFPEILQIISEQEVRELHRFALGSNRKSNQITFERLSADVKRVLNAAQRDHGPQI